MRPRAPQPLVVLAWISLAVWLLFTRGLQPGPALPPGLAPAESR